jgi:tetratricopeptide (TPR) repeat protein
VKSRPPSSPEGSATHAAGAARIEPLAGDWSTLHFDDEPRRDPASSHARRQRWTRIALAVAALAVLSALIVWRQPLSEWLWPDTRLQSLREQAARALAEGRLTSPDGRGARELYEAALALDPDRSDARTGLTRTGEAALQQARQAIDGGHFEFARGRLELARDLATPRDRVETLAQRLREREATHAGLDRMVAAAASAREQGRLDGAPDTALPLYQRVLELQPQRNDALEGRDDTLAELLQQARQALENGELVRGAQGIQRAQQADPGHADLPDSLTVLERHIERRRREADQALRRQRLELALAAYRDLLAVRADDGAARNGLVAIADAHAARAERLAADFDFVQAEAELAQAREIAVTAPSIAVARQHLDRARESHKRFDQEAPGKQRQSLQRLLAQAAAAEQRGDLLTPPGDSAYDKLRAAQAIAPQNPAVRAAVARLLPTAKRCFERELSGNRLGRAGECLDARRTLEGSSAPLREAASRLALRWIAVGDERLGAGEVQAARAALQAARSLDASAPGLHELTERVKTARAAGE